LFVVSKDDILKVNGIAAGADVKPGQKIKIPPSSM
jgi:LysM repeat protein